jgi:fructokinase
MSTAKVRIGIDLGGTKTEIVVLDATSGTELLRRRVSTERTYEGVVRGVRDLVETAERDLGRTGTVGVGIPGTISKETGCIKNANSTWINGRPLDRDLAHALGREVRLENDANCFAVSEARDGAGAGCEVVFGVILGTGVGAGLVVDGRCLRGVNGIGGEWGHNPLPWPRTLDDQNELPGRSCYCGKSGCIETWLSGPAFEADYFEATGNRRSAQAIAADAVAVEPQACAALARYVDRLARGLAHVINIIDPDVVVLGGGMGKLESLYRAVPTSWGRYVFSDSVRTQIKPPLHGDSSGVRGAAWLWP